MPHIAIFNITYVYEKMFLRLAKHNIYNFFVYL